MYLVYLDESGNTGKNAADKQQPIFVLGALLVHEGTWQAIELDMERALTEFFPDRPEGLEIHAHELRGGIGYFRGRPIEHRLKFIEACFGIAQRHKAVLIYRAVIKLQFKAWVESAFGKGVDINPHVVSFALVARVVDDYLKNEGKKGLGIFISDENDEIIGDVEKSIRLLRGMDGSLKLGQIIEKGFFIDSRSSLLLQLCDLCVFYARKKEEQKQKMPFKPMDQVGLNGIEPLIHRGNEALQDTLQWVVEQQKKGAARGTESQGR